MRRCWSAGARLAALALLGIGCSDTENAGPARGSGGAGGSGGILVGAGGASGLGGAGSGGKSGAGAGGGAKCPAPEPPALGQVQLVDSVHASLIDQDGQPAENVLCSVCAVDVCGLPSTSDAQGQVTIYGPGAEQRDPRFNVSYDGRGYAKLAALIPKTPSHDFGTVRVLRLPPFSSGAVVAPGKDALSGGVTLSPPAGATIEFDQILFEEPDRRFVAALLDIRALDPAELPAVDPALGLEVLIGTGPIDTKLCPPAALRFDNVAGWPGGTDVEIYMNGTKIYEHFAPYGQWAFVASALVDASGATVGTKPGQGIAALGTFGARTKAK